MVLRPQASGHRVQSEQNSTLRQHHWASPVCAVRETAGPLITNAYESSHSYDLRQRKRLSRAGHVRCCERRGAVFGTWSQLCHQCDTSSGRVKGIRPHNHDPIGKHQPYTPLPKSAQCGQWEDTRALHTNFFLMLLEIEPFERGY